MAEGRCTVPFVDRHQVQLIQRVKHIGPILDELLSYYVINRKSYDEIISIPDSREKMSALFRGPLESSGDQGKEIFHNILKKYEPHLIIDLDDEHERMQVGTTTSQMKLFETLNDLSSEEFDTFKSLIALEKDFPFTSGTRLKSANTQDIVALMVETYSHECVESTKKVLTSMNRNDLVQRLSDISSENKEQDRGTDRHSNSMFLSLVDTKVSDIELLLETLNGLSDKDFKKFTKVLERTHLRSYPNMTDRQHTALMLVQTYLQQYVEKTKQVLKKIKRTDLVQRLSDGSSGPKKKNSGDEDGSALILKVATMTAVKELLLETLNDLSYDELKNFKWFLLFTAFRRSFVIERMSWRELQNKDTAETLIEFMVKMCGQQSVEMTKEVLVDMNRTDLVQRLSETSSGLKAAGSSAEAFTTEREKHSVDENWPALNQKVEGMASVIELLLETLKGLSVGQLQMFKEILSGTDFHRRSPNIPGFLEETRREDTVFSMVLTRGQRSVEKTQAVLQGMKKTDLVQRLSDSSLEPKKKQSDERRPALIQRVATIAAVKQLLWESLKDLSEEELRIFQEFLELILCQKYSPEISLGSRLDAADTVDLMMEIFGLQSVEFTREIFRKMNKTDLMQRLSKPISGLKEKHSVEEHQPAPLEDAAMAAVKHILLESLKKLSLQELGKFKWLLQFTQFEKGLPRFSWLQLHKAASAEALVNLMVSNQQPVEVTMEVFMDMNRTDLVKRLSETWAGLKEKHQCKPLQKGVTMASPMETLKDLSHGELEQFKDVLQSTRSKKGLPGISGHRIEMAGSVEIVELMVEIYGQRCVEVTKEVLMEMNRSDLVQRSSDISSGSKGPSGSLELDGCGSITQASSDWTKLEPEVNSTDAHKAPTYSLQSEGGNFECSVSGLRWVCKEKVSFKYQFCSWEEPMGRMESINYMPAGPIIDVTVITGKFLEVHLPHWICIDDNPAILDKFATLHIRDCGDVVEKVSEVTRSHVKLSEPVFSPRAALVKLGLPVKIDCNVLIYKTNTAFLTLHVYLIPCDTGLQQEMDRRELSYGYKIIRKPHPERSLKMHDRFILTADLDGAEISPEALKLRYKSRNPNFFEVFIENPDRNFTLKLKRENEHQPVWTHAIRKEEYQSAEYIQGEHFVDKHRCDLINKVSNIGPILDNLLRDGVMQQEVYDIISASPTTQEKMRRVYSGPLNAAGSAGKEIFYKILKEKETYLVADLKREK